MKVNDLIKQLKNFPPSQEIVICHEEDDKQQTYEIECLEEIQDFSSFNKSYITWVQIVPN